MSTTSPDSINVNAASATEAAKRKFCSTRTICETFVFKRLDGAPDLADNPPCQPFPFGFRRATETWPLCAKIRGDRQGHLLFRHLIACALTAFATLVQIRKQIIKFARRSAAAGNARRQHEVLFDT